MTTLNWEDQIEIDDIGRYMEELRHEFARHGVRVKLEDQRMELNFPFQGLSPKRVISLVDAGLITWRKLRDIDQDYRFTFSFSLKRAFYIFTFFPFILILMMLAYNYYTNPFFSWNWTKLAVLGLGNGGWIYFLYLKTKVENHFVDIFNNE
ncbi:MAG: hypothetical protein KBA26_09680 [Candidatus Delongbacteria bacterium]|nr:hypothetical protein [Candidatus Delongbacteria bacterium]